MAIDIKKRLPGLLALTYDTALRGTHIRELARSGRLVTVAPIAAKSVSDTGKRTEKRGPLGAIQHTRPDGLRCIHTFEHVGGRLHEQRVDGRGAKSSVPCTDPVVRFRDNKATHRMYLEWEIKCVAGLAPGSRPVTVKGSWTVTDDHPSLNVAENLRALPPGSPRYDEAHGWRQTIENDNHQSDARKVQGRGRSRRPDWNHLNELGWALMQNGIALQKHRARNTAGSTEPIAAQPARAA
jgi:hypothetical protein